MIRRASMLDVTTVSELASQLWDGECCEYIDEFSELISSDECAIYIDIESGQAVGFAQCQLRCDYVEGTDSSPVGYLEGIFVRPEFRGQGRARRLLESCQDWARAQGCTEFASDCELDNETSLRFHLKTGFIEANRIICFTKQL